MSRQQDDFGMFDYDNEEEYYEEEYYDDEEYERSFLGITWNGFLGGFESIGKIIISIVLAVGILGILFFIIGKGSKVFKIIIDFICHSYYLVYIIPLIFLYMTMNFKSNHKDSASEGAALLFLISLVAIILVELRGYGFINDKNKIKEIEPVVSSVINIVYPK